MTADGGVPLARFLEASKPCVEAGSGRGLLEAPRRVAGAFAFRSRIGGIPVGNVAQGMCANSGVSTGMRKVPSMVFDMELEDDDTKIGTQIQSETAAAVARLENLLTPRSFEESALFQAVKEICAMPGIQSDWRLLASQLQHLGYGVKVRKAVGGGEGDKCLKNLRHSFLRCSIPGTRMMYIVDPDFKGQFSIMHPTTHYSTLLAAIPSPVVLPEDRVAPVVQLISKELSQVFKQLEVVLPPWRTTSSVLTKWLPRQSLDQSVGDPTIAEQVNYHPRRRSMPFDEAWEPCFQGKNIVSAGISLGLGPQSWNSAQF